SLFIVIFFFSSRRRHTRWPRDWSSDVCSSDLDSPVGVPCEAVEHAGGDWFRDYALPTAMLQLRQGFGRFRLNGATAWPRRSPGRSEERRVGKECRSRWWRYN